MKQEQINRLRAWEGEREVFYEGNLLEDVKALIAEYDRLCEEIDQDPQTEGGGGCVTEGLEVVYK